MKKLYWTSSFILAAMTLLTVLVVTINEDISVKVAGVLIFPIFVFFCSIPSRFISRRIIKRGRKIERKAVRVMYYIVLPLLSLGLFYAIMCLLTYWDEQIPSTGDFATELGRALLFVVVLICIFIMMILPYIQTYLVLALKAYYKNKRRR